MKNVLASLHKLALDLERAGFESDSRISSMMFLSKFLRKQNLKEECS